LAVSGLETQAQRNSEKCPPIMNASPKAATRWRTALRAPWFAA